MTSNQPTIQKMGDTARRNKWTLGYIAAVSTLGVVIQIIEGVRGN